ncbi:DUF2516 family protein [Demetria terragena]|uniref:DUF2516 family protein n=1 Tax=Demetria terragena TaxID=63959 RepID=UPI00037839D2|nr:DUF2516 family protein [Demetria terragena]
MDAFFKVQGGIALILSIGVIAVVLVAFLDSLRHRVDAFPAAGKLTKPIWCGILGVGVLLSLLTFGNPLNIFTLLVVVASAVYLADVRPALQRVVGGGRSNGPYGPW